MESVFCLRGTPPTESKGVLGRAQSATAAPGLRVKDVLSQGFGGAGCMEDPAIIFDWYEVH